MNIKRVYIGSDGRARAYYTDDNGVHHVRSYPRILMEEKLGRPLEPNEDIHHLDEDPLNNSIDNLVLVDKSVHCRHHAQRYFDKMAICDVCHKEFLWTAKRQSNYYRDESIGRKRIITCSKSCSSRYGRYEQLGRNPLTECELNGES